MSAAKHRGAPLPEDEHDRLSFLYSLNILDTVAEDAFDDITRSLVKVFDVPIALVSLVDSERQWFKSHVGLAATEMPRDESFCAYVLIPYIPEILLVPDATQDSRFCSNPLVVGEPYIRFYCGAPIILQGHRLGALCIIDYVPRHMGKQESMLLANFADVVASFIDRERQSTENHDMRDNPTFLINSSEESWPILYMNSLGTALLNPSRGSMPSFLNHFSFDELDRDLPLYETQILRGMFGFKRFCSCVLYPATRQIAGSNSQHAISFPYTDRSLSGSAHASTALPNTIAVGANARGKCYFIVVKLDKEEAAESAPSGSSCRKLWFPMPRQMSLLDTAEAFAAATQEKGCAVMFSSRFCGSCSRFIEYYTLLCTNSKDGVHFCVVNIDDATYITATLGLGAMILPMVRFYSYGVMVDEMAGGSCSEFRQRLKAFVNTSVKPASTAIAGGQPALQASGRSAASAPHPPMTSHPSRHPATSSSSSSSSSPIVPDRAAGAAAPADAAQAPEGQGRLQKALSYLARKANISKYLGMHGSEPRPVSSSSSSSSSSHPVPGGERAFGGTGAASDSVFAMQGVRAGWSDEPPGSHIPQAKRALHEQLSGDLELNATMGNPYRFAGSVLSCLSPFIAHRRVLIYGGQLADRLGDDMASVGIDAQRQECTWPNKELVVAASKSNPGNQPVAVVNINDFWSPADIHTSFVEVIKALSAADVFVVFSSENRFLDVLSLLGTSSGWASKCTKGSEREYWIMVFHQAGVRGSCSSCVYRPGRSAAGAGAHAES